ncbi:MAG: antibiotic biosynthesis monooxygenase [Ginsengibacter sp.]
MIHKSEKRFLKEVNTTYSVLEDTVDENVRLIQNVVKQLREEGLPGVKYSVYKMGKNVFIHTAQFTTEEAYKKFDQLTAFKKFRSELGAKLKDKPITNVVEEIDSYTALEFQNATT